MAEQAVVPGRWDPSTGEPVNPDDIELMGMAGLGHVDHEDEDNMLESDSLEEKRGLWANIHARRKAGKRPKRPGEKGYPKTLDIESQEKTEADDLKEAAPTVKGLKKVTFEDIQKKFPRFAKILQLKFGDEISSASFAFSAQGFLGMGKVPMMVGSRYSDPVVYWDDNTIKYSSSDSLANAVRDAA